ncbi:MAG: SpoIIE family protein phosphatase [Candidatus Acidiferrales bacterium]
MKKKPPVAQYVVLGLLFFAVCAYQVRATIASFPGFLDQGIAKWPFLPGYSHGEPTAAFVRPEAFKAGVRERDIVTGVNGRAFTGLAVFGEAMAKAKPGDTLEVSVRTPGSNTERAAKIPLATPSRTINWAVAAVVMLKVVLPALSILLGFWVAFVRPRDISAWLLIGVLLGLCNLFASGTESWGRWVRDLAEFYRTGCNVTWPLWMLFFGLYFPQPFPDDRGQDWVRLAKCVLAPMVIVDAIVSIAIRIGEVESYATVSHLAAFWDRLGSIPLWLDLIAVGGFFASISLKWFTAVSPDKKRRLRLLYAGTTVSLTPTMILIVIAEIKGGELEQVFPEWLVLVSLTLLLLFPITLAYVIVVQRALDMRVVIRQGLQYALATGGIRVLQVVLTAGVLLVAVNLAISHGSRSQKMSMIAGGAFFVFMLRRAADYLRKWIDRRFFRDAYDAEQILAGLSDEVRSMLETRPMLERVMTRIAESLHVPRIAVLLQEGAFYRPAYAVGYAGVPQIELPETAATIEHLRKDSEPARVYFDDEDSWVNTSLPEAERRSLAKLEPQLLLPLSVKDKLLGIVSLSEKRSEEPYSGTDLRLLKSVATQAGLALANAQLTATIAYEVGRREKMNRELEIAREVQERLFPQKLPHVPGLDYSGQCRTALGVGGDYYDFLALPAGVLGIALADVSGKGIAAALMMASLQASLRAEVPRVGNDIGGMIARVNQMLYDASAEDRYATLFYAQYDPVARRFTYVNAGHNPPMMFRDCSGNGQVERLDQKGGPVVGLMMGCQYEQAEIALAPGDVVVMYTDGISEAMNRCLEEWGEKRLVEAVRETGGLPAERVIGRIMQAANAFAGGAPQSDDMTLVVLRVIDRPV